MAVVRMLPLDLLGILWRKSFEDTAPTDAVASRFEVLVTTKLLSAQHKATAEATSSSLIAIFCDSDIPQVVDGALWVLSHAPHLKFLLLTTGVSVEEKLLTHLADMLEAPDTPEWRLPVGVQILSNLALHEPTAVTIVEANTLNSVEKLLRSCPADLYQHIFSMLKNLASHELTAMAIIHMILLDLFSTRLRHTVPIDELAMWWERLVMTKLLDAPRQATAEATCSRRWNIMATISRSPYQIPASHSGSIHRGKAAPPHCRQAQSSEYLRRALSGDISDIIPPGIPQRVMAVLEANILTSVEKLLRSRPTDLYQPIFPMLASLASHKSTATAVLNMRLYDLLATLWHEDPKGRQHTPTSAVINLLTHIARWREGAEGMVAAKVLNEVLNGLHSLDHWIRLSTCRLLRELVGHQSTVQAVVAIVSREDIVALASKWNNWDYWASKVRRCAAKTLKILDATLERIDSTSCNH
ncbi:hypothetical protein C8J57DRAFT_1237060 [Mycena rebaudengoi]|nr:hypothetical protein C8J57DRAFT_1237060 [Mycena rebaudengoi]